MKLKVILLINILVASKNSFSNDSKQDPLIIDNSKKNQLTWAGNFCNRPTCTVKRICVGCVTGVACGAYVIFKAFTS